MLTPNGSGVDGAQRGDVVAKPLGRQVGARQEREHAALAQRRRPARPSPGRRPSVRARRGGRTSRASVTARAAARSRGGATRARPWRRTGPARRVRGHSPRLERLDHRARRRARPGRGAGRARRRRPRRTRRSSGPRTGSAARSECKRRQQVRREQASAVAPACMEHIGRAPSRVRPVGLRSAS